MTLDPGSAQHGLLICLALAPVVAMAAMAAEEPRWVQALAASAIGTSWVVSGSMSSSGI
jgi:hypothetical protein